MSNTKRADSGAAEGARRATEQSPESAPLPGAGRWSAKRDESNCVAPDSLVVELDDEKQRTSWWTFAGLLANAELAQNLGAARSDNFGVFLDRLVRPQEFSTDGYPSLHQPDMVTSEPLLKFHECLPGQVLQSVESARCTDASAVEVSRSSRLLFRNKNQ
ncbi:MAG: hypothetical protein ACJ746_20725 [Bryobacteraceae bacterium]